MNRKKVMCISDLCVKYAAKGLKKNMVLVPASFDRALFDDVSDFYETDGIVESWKMVVEALEEREWVVSVFENNYLVTDRWGKW